MRVWHVGHRRGSRRRGNLTTRTLGGHGQSDVVHRDGVFVGLRRLYLLPQLLHLPGTHQVWEEGNGRDNNSWVHSDNRKSNSRVFKSFWGPFKCYVV